MLSSISSARKDPFFFYSKVLSLCPSRSLPRSLILSVLIFARLNLPKHCIVLWLYSCTEAPIIPLVVVLSLSHTPAAMVVLHFTRVSEWKLFARRQAASLAWGEE